MSRPSFQFYPGDWQRDAGLRAVSVGARGCWLEMICIMHQADPYGHLVLNGEPVDEPTLARMIGATEKEVGAWLRELEKRGVFDREDDGTIVSRRMVRDEQVRRARAAGGSKGGNPNLLAKPKGRGKDASKVGSKVNLPPNLRPTPSSSSSSSSSPSSLRSDGPRAPDAEERGPPTLGAQASKAMRDAGATGVNPSDPELLQLLAQGVTPRQLGDLAAELRETRGSAISARYAIRTMIGRLRDAASQPDTDPATAQRTGAGDPARAQRIRERRGGSAFGDEIDRISAAIRKGVSNPNGPMTIDMEAGDGD